MATSYALRRAISAFSFPNYGVSNPGPRGPPPCRGLLARSKPSRGRKRIGSRAHAVATSPAVIRGSGRLQRPR